MDTRKRKIMKLLNQFRNALRTPLKFHWTSLILLFLLISLVGITKGIILGVILLGSLLFHEYSHVWMAHRQGIGVSQVIVHGFGAAALMIRVPLEAYWKQLRISFAGPAASFFLAGFFYLPYAIASQGSSSTAGFLRDIIFINVVLGIFNLLPIFPSDGGRILYSIIGMLKRGPFKAIKWAVYTSWVVCTLGIIYGLITFNIWLVAILGTCIYSSIIEKRETEKVLNNIVSPLDA